MWRDIDSKVGAYKVSDAGAVKNGDRVLKGWVTDKGYRRVTIDGKSCAVHRLVATAFLPNVNEYPEVNHINGVKLDNRLQNLEWCTRSQNMRHCYQIGIHPGVRLCGEDHALFGKRGALHPQSMPVRAVFPDGTSKDYESQGCAADDGYRPNKISDCINGRIKTHGGAKWMPLPEPPEEQ